MDIFKKLFIPKETLSKINAIKEIVYTTPDKHKDIDINEMISKLVPLSDHDEVCEIPNVLHDVEMFTSFVNDNDDDDESTLFDTIMKTNLKGSSTYLKRCIERPTNDIEILRKRVSTLKDLENKINNVNIDRKIDQLRSCEDSLPWLFNKRDSEDIRAAYNLVYFNTVVTRPLNKVPELLTSYNLYKIIASPIIGILSPIAYFLIPYIIIVFKFKLKMGFFTYVKSIVNAFLLQNNSMHIVSVVLSALFYFQGVFNSVEISKATYSISKYIVNSMSRVSDFLITSKQLCDDLWTADMDVAFFNGKTSTSCDHDCRRFKQFSIISNFGEPLCDFKSFEPTEYIALIQCVYKLDAIVSICKIKHALHLSYPIFLDSKKPTLDIKGVFHPYLKSPVRNNFQLEKTRGAIITGPNAGGKSTIIKSVLINILLSQTICIANSTSTQLTPFKYIASQINVPDRKGKQSLFEAEMFRAKYTLDKLDTIDGFSIIFMDEIFNSTNPVEGISGAYAIAKKMSSYAHNMMIFTTHYLYLTKLANEFPERFTNMKMNVNMNSETGKITFPYRLRAGISRQWIALELLKQNHFDETLISDAICIKARLHSRKKCVSEK
jgi:hypothetical protein